LKFDVNYGRAGRLSEDAVWDTEKGELRILGKRHTAIDAQTLCSHLDSLVGVQVAEVIMHNLEFRLGKLDAARLKPERPQAPLNELVEHLAKTDRLSGIGVTKVTLAEDPQKPIHIEVANPNVKGTTGAARAFLFSWWAGALTALLDKEFDVKYVAYDETKNLLKGQIAVR
jgi:hypothetical protein